MTLGRIKHMYGDKPPLYTLSVCFLCFGCGWLVAQYGRFGLEGILVHAIGLLIAVHFVDAIIKSIFFVKEHCSISVKCN